MQQGGGAAAAQPRPPAAATAADEAADRLRALHRTPVAMVFARMKVLLERLRCHGQLQLEPGLAAAVAAGGGGPGAASQGQRQGLTAAGGSAKHCPSGRRLRVPGGAGERELSGAALLAELDAMLCFSSPFLAALAPTARAALARAAAVEAYAKGQLIHAAGHQAERFFVVLLGEVDVWTHPPGQPKQRSLVTVLRRGETFGGQALAASGRHTTAATPASNTTLLVVLQQDFMPVLGAHFLQAAADWRSFLLGRVAPLANMGADEAQRLCSSLFSSRPPEGKEWEVARSDQLLFIKEGRFELQAVDLEEQRATDAAAAAAAAHSSTMLPPAAAQRRRQPPAARPQGACLLSLGSQGALAAVQVRGGHAVGTLGEERELHRRRQQAVPRQTLAVLGSGGWFGGGNLIYGSGTLQSSLRVVAKGPKCELLHVRLDSVAAHAGGAAVVRRLQEDAAFKLQYYLGRLGRLGGGALPGLTAQASPQWGLQPQPAAAPLAPPLAAPMPAADGPGAGEQAAEGAAADAAEGGGGGGAATAAAAGEQAAVQEEGCQPAAAERHGESPPDAAGTPPTAQAAAAPPLEPSGAPPPTQAGPPSPPSPSGGARRGGRQQRQRHAHVAGSGVFRPGTMAILRHVADLQQQAGGRPRPATAAAAHPSAATTPRGGAPRAAAGRPASAAARLGGPHGGGGGPRCAVTAAERYHQALPDHSASPASAGLEPLLGSIFPAGLQPLVGAVQELIGHAAAEGMLPAALLDCSNSPRGRDSACQRPPSAHARVQGATAGKGTVAAALQHSARSSLLAASVMWQRSSSSSACLCSPLRQFLTSQEIVGQQLP